LATFSATQTRRDKEKGHGNRVKRMCLAFASKRHCSVGGWVGGLMGWWVENVNKNGLMVKRG